MNGLAHSLTEALRQAAYWRVRMAVIRYVGQDAYHVVPRARLPYLADKIVIKVYAPTRCGVVDEAPVAWIGRAVA